MLRTRPFTPKPRPDRAPMAWPGVQNFAQAPRCDGAVAAQPKTEAIRSEPYRRLVAAMPCKACGIQGYSQAAHLPPDGKGVKQDDRLIFPLCCTRVGITGCHADYDQYRMFTHDVALTVGMGWAMDTMRAVVAAGDWPKNLPFWSNQDGV
jgi:hypothetical protein